jgi:hypothetical protein
MVICEILFVPVDIRVQLIVALKDGKPIGRGLKAELVNHNYYYKYNKGVVRFDNKYLCTSDANRDDPHVEIFPLRGATSDNSITFNKSISFTGQHNTIIDLPYFGLNAKMKCDLSYQNKIDLECHLIGGHNYYMFHTRKLPGICWRNTR